MTSGIQRQKHSNMKIPTLESSGTKKEIVTTSDNQLSLQLRSGPICAALTR